MSELQRRSPEVSQRNLASREQASLSTGLPTFLRVSRAGYGDPTVGLAPSLSSLLVTHSPSTWGTLDAFAITLTSQHRTLKAPEARKSEHTDKGNSLSFSLFLSFMSHASPTQMDTRTLSSCPPMSPGMVIGRASERERGQRQPWLFQQTSCQEFSGARTE